MRPEVVSRESQPDNQSLVAKNAFFIAEDRVRELRVEAGECLGLFLVRLDQGDMDSVVGIARPYSSIALTVSLAPYLKPGKYKTKYLQSSSLDIVTTKLAQRTEIQVGWEEVVESSVVVFFLEKPRRRALDRVRDLKPGSRASWF